jgi:hypothetical protein
MEKEQTNSNSHHALSIALWFAPQWLILLLTLGHVPLWLNLPIRMDDLVLPMLLSVQIVTAAMLFPLLLRNWQSLAATIAVSWPILQFAAFVSAVPLAQWASAAAYLSLLLLVLGTWNIVLRSQNARLLAAAFVTILTIGGALLAYLQAEFSGQPAPSLNLSRTALWSPLLGALSQLHPNPPRISWWPLLAALIIGLIAIFLSRKATSARKKSLA